MIYFCCIYVFIQKVENNIDDITLLFDLPYDGLCFFLKGRMFMKELTLHVYRNRHDRNHGEYPPGAH